MKKRLQRGFTIVELMFAMVILAVGSAGALAVCLVAINTNSGTKFDSGAMYAAQAVIERMSQPPTMVAGAVTHANLIVPDCGGNAWVVATAPGGATLNATGQIIWAGVDYDAVPNNYKMRFQTCGTNGDLSTIEVRWNVQQLNGVYSKLITVSARPARATGPARFSRPVELRTVVAM